jgi:hypothetical protein
VGAVTLTVTVHVPPAAMAPPVKLMDVAAATGANVGVPHPDVVAPGAAATRIWPGDVGKTSENATPLMALPRFGLATVNVSVDTPF